MSEIVVRRFLVEPSRKDDFSTAYRGLALPLPYVGGWRMDKESRVDEFLLFIGGKPDNATDRFPSTDTVDSMLHGMYTSLESTCVSKERVQQ